MKKNIFLFVIVVTSFQLQAQSYEDMRVKSAVNEIKAGNFESAINLLEQVGKDISNVKLQIKVKYLKLKATDKLIHSKVEKDRVLQRKLITDCKNFIKDFQHNKFTAPTQCTEIYNILVKNEKDFGDGSFIVQGQKQDASKEILSREKDKIVTRQDTVSKAIASNKNEGTVIEKDSLKDKIQPDEKSPQNDESKKEEVSKDDQIENLKKELSKYKSSVRKDIGAFEFRANKVMAFGMGEVAVDSLDIEIKDGFIRTIRVFVKDSSGNRMFFVNHSPISLIRFNDNTDNNLYLSNDSKFRFSLGNVLSYIASTGNNYTPDNINITLKKVNEKHIIWTDEGLSNYIDYRIYSDFLGLIDEAKNGIINFEAIGCIPVMPSNIYKKNIYFMKSIKPHFRYSRFDNDDRAIILYDAPANAPTRSVSNKLDIIRNSFICGGFTFDIFTFDPRETVFQMNIPFKLNFNLTEVGLEQKENITSTYYGSGLELKFSRTNNFGMTLYSYLFEVRHNYNENRIIEKIKPFTIYNIGAELFFFNSSANANSAVFLRFNYMSEITSSNNFFQLQIGYKSSLNF